MKANFSKSELIGIHVEEGKVQQLAGIFVCKASSFPTVYLGLHITVGKAGKEVWNPVVERVEKKLSLWKARKLSLGGRIILITTVLSCLPIYFLSILKCPMSMAHRIEKLERDFLWQSGGNLKKFHLMDWESVCRRKVESGLGFRHIRDMNQALLRKWLWRIENESGGLRRWIIFSKYGHIRDGWGLKMKAVRGSALWRGVAEVWECFQKGIGFRVGYGECVLF